MPRPTKSRSSLPRHERAARLNPAAAVESNEDMQDVPMASTSSAHQLSLNLEVQTDSAPAAPPKKRTKVEKQLAKRAALLEKIKASQTPYSKSHAKRMRRKARPENNLNAQLDDVELALDQVQQGAQEDSDEHENNSRIAQGQTGGQGKERLTRKKRERVLQKEAKRLPAVMSNPAFASNPFATIRLHTINTINAQKNRT